MFPDPQYFRIQFVTAFKRNQKIREKVFEYEKQLTSLPKPFKMLTISDDEDPNIPRFQSGNNKNSLEVTQQRVTLNIETNDLKDIKTIQNILDHRIGELKPLLLTENIFFIALVLHIRYIFTTDEEIYNNFRELTKAKAAESNDLIGFSFFYAKPFKNSYFLNINCERFQETIIEGKIGQEFKEKDKKLGINIIIDLNTRLLNSNKSPFNEEMFNKIQEDIFPLLENNSYVVTLSGEIK